MTPEVIRRLPKTDLHVHLDGSLRLGTLIELARERGIELPSFTEDGLRAVDAGIRRASDAFNARPEVASGREPRFAAGIILCALRYFTPDLSEGYRRILEALPEASPQELHSAASMQVARAAARLKHDEGLLVVGIDLAGQEKGYPAEDHRVAYQVAHEAFLGKPVHAGEDYGPESM